MQVAILQTVPDITITNGVPTTFLPLSIVLSFDGIVTAREDYKRHVDDARANSSESEYARPSGSGVASVARFRRRWKPAIYSLRALLLPCSRC
jgi:hypothetical protein